MVVEIKANRMSRKGQIAIFIILALILVVSILLIFAFRNPPEIEVLDDENPQASIESCVSEVVNEVVNVLSVQGGDFNPQGSVMYQGRNITYLCYINENYLPCVNQRPLLIEHIENEIKVNIRQNVENCFENLKAGLERRYEVEMGSLDIDVNLNRRKIKVDLIREMRIVRGDNVREFKDFKVEILNPIYDLAKIAGEIVNQESEFCNFNEVGFMLIYPEYDVQRIKTGDSDTIYILQERVSGKDFNFAVRSCVMPPGI
ncbi:hypothetical protein HOD75_04915 [archaeon]|jgi:hypothetical protein|nr:hypothetical protein [archaeon]MBT4242206.1 hypothetical protein [archaeon]MBT4417894.1 hypothetical protein [archaeon]